MSFSVNIVYNKFFFFSRVDQVYSVTQFTLSTNTTDNIVGVETEKLSLLVSIKHRENTHKSFSWNFVTQIKLKAGWKLSSYVSQGTW